MKNKTLIIILLLASPIKAETNQNEYKSKAKDLLKAYGTHIATVATHQLTLYTLAKIAIKVGARVQPGQSSDVIISAWPLFLGMTVYLPEFQNQNRVRLRVFGDTIRSLRKDGYVDVRMIAAN